MIATTCYVESITQLTSTVHKIILTPDTAIDFKAGQYLQVVMGEKDKRPFSIANSPHNSNFIELHLGADPANKYAFEVLQTCQNDKQIDVEIGLGDAYLRTENCPCIIVAGGTGYSYAKSILYSILEEQPNRLVSLYWGAKAIADLYELDELRSLAITHPNFTFKPVLENPPSDWKSHTGWVHKAVMNDISNFSEYHVYAAGRFEMASAIRDEYSIKGLVKHQLFGDAYAFI